ncbi:hypothetical protein [Catellatospora paridis]|uniref:hypothetical protein n=1 Tax=Catellatospora paridis TaxID=1617086 RepID=UPI0012D4B72B|nr:hypothetical protein [Catellatospora paridis]
MPHDKYYADANALLALHRPAPGANTCDQRRCSGEQWPCSAVQVAEKVIAMYDETPTPTSTPPAPCATSPVPAPAAALAVPAPPWSGEVAIPHAPLRPAAQVPAPAALTPWVTAEVVPASGWQLTALGHSLPSTLPMARDVGNVMDLIFRLGFATIKQLAVRLGRSQQEISPSLAALREVGWIAHTGG